ncbi:MAG: hypothetical protein KBH99_02280 [Syntrophobacteraceae bacterium]|nr:hypothetical protein [Syntrophobacteraceae bacterium]
MVRKAVLLILGFGMIAAGIAGICVSVVDQRGTATLEQMERLFRKSQASMAEDLKKIEERRQEVDKLAAGIEAEKRRIWEEKRRAVDELRTKEAELSERKRELAAGAPTASKSGGEKRNTSLAAKDPKPRKEAGIKGGHRGSSRAMASKTRGREGTLRGIVRKASAEAARLSRPVKYHNLKTRELLLAEPVDYGFEGVRVRIRVWRDRKLIRDTTITITDTDDVMPESRPTRRARGRDFV